MKAKLFFVLLALNNILSAQSSANGKPQPVDINEFFISEFYVYPNPVTEQLNIKSKNSSLKNAKVKLFDVTGKLVHLSENTNIEKEHLSVQVGGFLTGFYFYEISSHRGIYRNKFLKN